MSTEQQQLPNREGQRVPDVSFRIRRNGQWATVTTDDLFKGRNVVVFSLLASAWEESALAGIEVGFEGALPEAFVVG